MPPTFADPPAFRYKPTRADAARANGLLSRGPATPEGRRRSSMNGLVHGLRARRWVAVPALGESPALVEAHFAAVCDELGSTGPVGRHLAETAASAVLRAARADRMEGELLAGLGGGDGSVAKALHGDRDARATFALLQRYRREADNDVRRSLDTLFRLHRARIEGLVPDGEEAQAVEADLDTEVADLPAPSEPTIEKIEPLQGFAKPANDVRRPAAPARPAPAAPAPPPFVPRAAPPPRPPEPPRVYTGAELLRQYRWLGAEGPRARLWGRITPAQRAVTLAAALAGRPDALDVQRDPEAPYEILRPLLAG